MKMVKTRTQLKIKIKEWIEQADDRFTTEQVRSYAQKTAPNIGTSANRITKYIKAQNIKFDKEKREWLNAKKR